MDYNNMKTKKIFGDCFKKAKYKNLYWTQPDKAIENELNKHKHKDKINKNEWFKIMSHFRKWFRGQTNKKIWVEE